VLDDLTEPTSGEIATERAGPKAGNAGLLDLEDPDGFGHGGACFPASYRGGEPGQLWTETMHASPKMQVTG